LFPTLKRELAGLMLSLDEFKTKWEGVIRTLTKLHQGVPEVAGAMQKLY
jgi:hypothetical protein